VVLVLVAGLPFLFLDIPPPPPNPAMERVLVGSLVLIKDGLLWTEVVGAKAVADAAKSAIDAIEYV